MSIIFLFGASGYIGSKVNKKLSSFGLKIKSVGRAATCDFVVVLTNDDLSWLSSVKSDDKVIFLAAQSSPQKCSEEYSNSYEINVVGTKRIIKALLEKGASVLFASSDVVYGETDNVVDEKSPINPAFEYAEMKAEVESHFLGAKNFYVMRLSYVWSLEDKFSRYILYDASKEKIKIYHPFVRPIVWLDDLIQLIKIFCFNPECIPALINVAGTEFLSRLDLIKVFKRHIDLKYEVVKPEPSFFTFRPRQILMTSNYFGNVLGQEPTKIKEAIDFEFDYLKYTNRIL